MNKENEYIQIDLLKIVNGLIRRFWMILISTVLCGALFFSYATFYITPLYESSVLLYVNNTSFAVGSKSFSISSSEITAAKSLVATYQVILKTRMTLNDVIRLGELNCSYEKLRGMIRTEAVNDTEVFSVTVTSSDPYEAEHIANTIGRVLPDKIASIVEGSSVRVVDYAVVPSGKVSPNISKYTMTGLLIGMLLSCGLIAVLEIIDDRIRSEDYLLQNFEGTPLLAVIPDMLEEKSKGQYYYSKYGYGYGYYGKHKKSSAQKSEKNSGKTPAKNPNPAVRGNNANDQQRRV